jgi:hypothetical protein
MGKQIPFQPNIVYNVLKSEVQGGRPHYHIADVDVVAVATTITVSRVLHYAVEANPGMPETVLDGLAAANFTPYFLAPAHGLQLVDCVWLLPNRFVALDLVVNPLALLASKLLLECRYDACIHRL